MEITVQSTKSDQKFGLLHWQWLALYRL